MATKKAVKTLAATLTPRTDTKSEVVKLDDSARLKEIRAFVQANNRSTLGTDIIICQIYMESRFEKDARAQGSSARGLMQLLKAPVRELARLKNLEKPRNQRRPEAELYREADTFHDSPELVDEAINIRTGTAYLQALIDKNTASGSSEPIVDAFKDYRGIRNEIYYRKIRSAAEKLSANPESMAVLREMVR